MAQIVAEMTQFKVKNVSVQVYVTLDEDRKDGITPNKRTSLWLLRLLLKYVSSRQAM